MLFIKSVFDLIGGLWDALLVGLAPILRLLGIAVAAVAFCLYLPGCKTNDQNERTLQMLREGNARGHVSLHSAVKLGVGAENNFWLGLHGTDLSFDGDVDWSRPAGAGPRDPG